MNDPENWTSGEYENIKRCKDAAMQKQLLERRKEMMLDMTGMTPRQIMIELVKLQAIVSGKDLATVTDDQISAACENDKTVKEAVASLWP